MLCSTLAIALTLQFIRPAIAGLRVSSVEVPRYLVVGQRATLKCHVELDGEILYSLKWWKDGMQFYQYIPNNKPQAVVFTVDGISINPAKSSLHEVELLDVQISSSGQYRCEVVAEAPTFTTHHLNANMSIIDAPDGDLKIRGLETSYRIGELISVNCSAIRSRPPASLGWTTNGDKVEEAYVVRYPVEHEGDPPLYTSTLGLSLTTRGSLFTEHELKLTCTATIVEYQWSTDVIVTLDNVTDSQPQHLPTLQQTDCGCRMLNHAILIPLLQLMLTIKHISSRNYI